MGCGKGGGELHEMEVDGTGSWCQKRKWGVESESKGGKESELNGIRDGGGYTKWRWAGPEVGVGSGCWGSKVKV